MPRIATGLAVGGQPAIVDPESAAKARKRATKAVKRTPGLSRSAIPKATPAEEAAMAKDGKKKSKKSKKSKKKGK